MSVPRRKGSRGVGYLPFTFRAMNESVLTCLSGIRSDKISVASGEPSGLDHDGRQCRQSPC
jgi:hypothetical protein